METRPVNKLIGFDKNPRKITDAAVDAVVESLKRHAQVKRIIISAVGHPFEQEVICCGHTTWKALKKFGATEAKVDVVQFKDETDFIHYNVVDNKSGEFSEWEFDMMANMFSHDEMMEMGFNDADLGLADFGEPDGGNIEDDEIPENVETVCKAGDLWQLGEHRLLCGDSTKVEDVERLMDGKKADMVFTSPPYNGNTTVGFVRKDGSGLQNTDLYKNNQTDDKTASEYLKFNDDIFKNIHAISHDQCAVLYNLNYNRNSPSEYIKIINNACELFNLHETIIWEKSMAISLAGNNLTRIVEFIFVLNKSDEKPTINKVNTNECIKNLWTISNNGANTDDHKACFPVALAEKGIDLYSLKEKKIFDPFLGSGSTLIACEKTKRKCYGMELDEHYCDVIIQRFQEFTGQKATKL